jgi:hypothetical protein
VLGDVRKDGSNLVSYQAVHGGADNRHTDSARRSRKSSLKRPHIRIDSDGEVCRQFPEAVFDSLGVIQKPLADLIGITGQFRAFTAEINVPKQSRVRFPSARLEVMPSPPAGDIDSRSDAIVVPPLPVEADFGHEFSFVKGGKDGSSYHAFRP